MILNMAVFAPIPRARVRTATKVKPGDLRLIDLSLQINGERGRNLFDGGRSSRKLILWFIA